MENTFDSKEREHANVEKNSRNKSVVGLIETNKRYLEK